VEYFGAALRAALAEEGIALAGAVQPSPALAGEGWRRLATHRSSLLTTLEVINKRSQNFYAESLLKLLGARLCGGGRPRPGSWPAGVRAAQEFLAEAGLEPGSYRLADGSGMSRNNLFTPEQLTLLLRHMYFHRWGTEFLKTLAYSGEHDLRWAARLAEPPYRGNVLAKTGSLSGVSALSGYAKARSGRIYAFSILMNRTGARWRAESAQDRIVRALIDHG
jgi:D-alanyl-D-alanine carboxypeptidase/D-alanyl-D-alanine-endopeptidase (penicillin-binding protein 4)